MDVLFEKKVKESETELVPGDLIWHVNGPKNTIFLVVDGSYYGAKAFLSLNFGKVEQKEGIFIMSLVTGRISFLHEYEIKGFTIKVKPDRVENGVMIFTPMEEYEAR